MTDKEKFLEMLPRVGIAAETIATTINMYFPCIEESSELFWDLCKDSPDRSSVFTPEEEQLIDRVNNKFKKLEKAKDWLNS